jgi:quercetin dioxygenase-like cupin family protein
MDGELTMATAVTIDQGAKFQMGKGDSRSLVNAEIGAQRISMNYSIFQPGQEFPQHFHDISADIFIVLEGGVSVREGDRYTPIRAGSFAYIPPGEVHGTVNQTDEQAILISFQSPPDMVMYRGERDPAVTGSVPRPPEGHISRVQVRQLDAAAAQQLPDGRLWQAASRADGVQEMTLWYVELDPGASFSVAGNVTSETVWFVWEGTAQVNVADAQHKIARRGVLFVPSNEAHVVTNRGSDLLRLIRCQAPA